MNDWYFLVRESEVHIQEKSRKDNAQCWTEIFYWLGAFLPLSEAQYKG